LPKLFRCSFKVLKLQAKVKQKQKIQLDYEPYTEKQISSQDTILIVAAAENI